jgi:hypothetical protein
VTSPPLVVMYPRKGTTCLMCDDTRARGHHGVREWRAFTYHPSFWTRCRLLQGNVTFAALGGLRW